MKNTEPKPICELLSSEAIDDHTIVTEYKVGRTIISFKSVFLPKENVAVEKGEKLND